MYNFAQQYKFLYSPESASKRIYQQIVKIMLYTIPTSIKGERSPILCAVCIGFSDTFLWSNLRLCEFHHQSQEVTVNKKKKKTYYSHPITWATEIMKIKH